MEKTIKFNVRESLPFTTYLKKFKSITDSDDDKAILFEIDLEKQRFIAKCTNPTKSVVKYSVITFDEAGFEIDTKNKERIKVGVYNIDRFINILKQFKKEFTFIVKYDNVIYDNETSVAATHIQLQNATLKFNVDVASLSVFKYITDDIFNTKIKNIDSKVEFDLTRDDISNIAAFCSIDKDHKYIDFYSRDNKVYARGKTFEYFIADVTCEDTLISAYKEQFDKIDSENYSVGIGSDRMLFTSTDTVTDIIVAQIQAGDTELSKTDFIYE